MSKARGIFLSIGLSLISLTVMTLVIGPSMNNGSVNVGSIQYDLEEGQHISWGLMDEYRDASDGTIIQSYKCLLDAEILAIKDLDIDADSEEDIALMTTLLLGNFQGQDIKIPAYLDIYVITTILLNELLSNFTVPPMNAIHYVTSQGANAMQALIEAIIGTGPPPTEENITDLLQYMSFYHVGILPSNFNYTMLEDLFLLFNEFTDSVFGFEIFEITHDTIQFAITINSTTMDSIVTLLGSNDLFFYEPGIETTFHMSWDKRINVLNETMVTNIHPDLEIERKIGFKLVRTTMDDSYPNIIPSSWYSFDAKQAADILTLKIAIGILVGTSALTLTLLFVDTKKIKAGIRR